MSQPDRISFSLSEAEKSEVDGAVRTLEKILLPRLVTLSPEARHELPKMGDKTLAFVEKAREYCTRNPEFVPAFLSVPAFETDLDAVYAIRGIFNPLSQLTKSLDDSMMLSGSEALTAGLMFYKSAATAAKANIHGAAVIHDDLSARYAARSAAVPATPKVS